MKQNILLLLLFVCFQPIFSATFNIPNGDVAALIAAINTANTNGQADIINLAANGEYVFTTINTIVTNMPTVGYRETNGPIALPVIRDEAVPGFDLIINLNGSVLRLSSTAPKMRLFQGGWDASWQLNGGTIKDFESPANNPVPGHGGGGGAVVVGARSVFTSESMTFDNCTSNSSEERSGGALSIGGTAQVTLRNSIYKNNTGPSNGGAITALLARIYVENCIFENNETTNEGGGAIYVDGCEGSITDPGGIGEIIGCTFTNNTARYDGGALYLQGYNEDRWFVKKCQFTSNKSVVRMAGAIWHSGYSNGEFNVSDSSFENNEAKQHGGAIRCTNGSNYFTNSTFYGNKTFDAETSGGAIWNFGDADRTWFSTIVNCTFVDNISGGYGGAWVISNDAAGTIRGSVKNTIISNNRAYTICGYPPPPGCNSTNNGNNCGSILFDLGNNIEYPERPSAVANPSNPDPNDRPCFARPVVQNSDAMPVINPLLSPLALNEGSTKTMALQAGSPAINAGSGCSPLDQRGATRNGNCDIGAYEYEGVLSTENVTENKNNLLLYPNPSAGEFFLKLPLEYEAKEGKMQVFALDGKLILEKNLNESGINTIKLAVKGMYILKTTIETQIFTNKILVH
ncbi:MAG TPA: choice-of-anchor Q domain-containing protein [Flavobacterium sp.]|jgi:predicted outer membrane repeat protein